jgi:hypothetical protein
MQMWRQLPSERAGTFGAWRQRKNRFTTIILQNKITSRQNCNQTPKRSHSDPHRRESFDWSSITVGKTEPIPIHDSPKVEMVEKPPLPYNSLRRQKTAFESRNGRSRRGDVHCWRVHPGPRGERNLHCWRIGVRM